MRVKLWGTRGTIPTPDSATNRYGGNTPCVEVLAASGDRLILDGGLGLHWLGLGLIEDGFGSGKGTAHLLLTHTHFAHIQGVPFCSPAMIPGNQFVVYGRGLGDDSLDDVLRKQMDTTYCPVPNFLSGSIGAHINVREIQAGEFAIGAAKVSAGSLSHVPGTPAFGFRIEADGAALAYIPDVEYVANTDRGTALALAAQVDLLIHDAHFTADEYTRMSGRGHCSADDAVSLAAAAGARRLLLFHHHPDRSDADIDAMVASYADASVLTEGACEGAEYEFG